MRAIGAAILATTMLVSSAFAATDASVPAPLAAGKPAGVKNAELEAGGVWLVIGLLGVAAGIAAIAATTQGNSTTTTGTSG